MPNTALALPGRHHSSSQNATATAKSPVTTSPPRRHRTLALPQIPPSYLTTLHAIISARHWHDILRFRDYTSLWLIFLSFRHLIGFLRCTAIPAFYRVKVALHKASRQRVSKFHRLTWPTRACRSFAISQSQTAFATKASCRFGTTIKNDSVEIDGQLRMTDASAAVNVHRPPKWPLGWDYWRYFLDSR
jgi:hypothetical protein